MLTRTESKVMTAILKASGGRESLLISAQDVLSVIGGETTETDVKKAVENLAEDGYFDLILSDRRGETVYCVTLKDKGKGYERSVKAFKRNLLYRLCLSAALAVFSFIIGLILKAVF